MWGQKEKIPVAKVPLKIRQNKLTIVFKSGSPYWLKIQTCLDTPDEINRVKTHYDPFFLWFQDPSKGEVFVFELDDGGKLAIRREDIKNACSRVSDEDNEENESDED